MHSSLLPTHSLVMLHDDDDDDDNDYHDDDYHDYRPAQTNPSNNPSFRT